MIIRVISEAGKDIQSAGTVDLKPGKKISYDKCKDLFKDGKLGRL